MFRPIPSIIKYSSESMVVVLYKIAVEGNKEQQVDAEV